MRASLILAALLALPSSALAQSADESATARALFDEGNRLFRSGKFKEACPKFEASLKFVDGLGTRGKLAECYAKDGRTASAWAMYLEVAEIAKKRGERRRERVANARAKKLFPMLAYVTVTVSGTPPAGMTVARNGVTLNAAAFGTAIAVDPGPHEFRASAEGHKPWSKSITIAAKERATLEIPPLVALPPPPEEPKETPVATAPAPSVSAQGPSDTGGSWRGPTQIALLAGGGALVATGLIFGGLAKSKYDGAFDDGHCDRDTNVCSAEGVSQTDSAKSQATVATVLVTGGLLVAGAGVVLWLWPKDDKSDGVSLTPVVGPRDLGVALSGRF